jgi:F-type H+-transporting ATPase subunit a
MARNFLRCTCSLFGSALLAFLLWFALVNSPLWPRSVEASASQEPAQTSKQKEIQHDVEEEKSALTHVLDTHHWELFDSFGPPHIELPKIFGFQITKFMVLELLAALVICAIYIPVARSMQNGEAPRGTFVNFFEVLLTFIRDEVAKPGLGEHDADKHVPFLWTLFLFILFNNLFGMVPLLGSATGSIFVTLALALCVFFYMHGCAIAKMGFGRYVMSMWPHMDLPFPLGYFIKPLIFGIEWVGVLVRNGVLAVRLFANVFAGHLVLVTMLLFIYMARHAAAPVWAGVTFTSVAGILALSLLELFVACLQAYIFTFLTSLFMGMALHPEH